MPSKDPLLNPFQLKHLTLRNRIISTSHAPNFVEDGHPRERYRLYHEEKAKGGVAMTMIGGSTNISPDSPSVFGQLYAGDDTIIPWFKELTTGVKKYGAAIMCQITHMGRRTSWDDGNWLPVIAASSARERAHRSIPKAMEDYDIRRIIPLYADAARRCQLGGFDGVEILVHAHLLGQFLSPLTNDRTDDYGGSLENRLRFTMQVLEAVREAVGDEFIVGLRITGDEEVDGGLSTQECITSAKLLSDSKMVDFLNVLAGAPYDDLGLAGWVAPMGMPSAPHLTIAGEIRAAVDVPILHAGGIADIATARHGITEGLMDLVGMTRAQIADPYLVSKLMQHKEEQIRPCVGLGYCVDRVNQGKDAICGHNPVSGRESLYSHNTPKAEQAKKIVVVGGGPAGLEAARICAQRGHDTILFEASNRLGGQLNLAAKGNTRQQISAITDWMILEVERLGVDIRLNNYADASEIQKENSDVVVIATGGWPELPDFEGSEFAVSSFDVLSGEARVGGRVLLWDEMGSFPAATSADVIAASDAELVFATPDRTPLIELGPTTYSVSLRDLYKAGVTFRDNCEISHIERSKNKLAVTLRNTLTKEEKIEEFDSVVIENGTCPMDETYHDAKPYSSNLGEVDQDALIQGDPQFPNNNPDGEFILFRIGDAITNRNIHAAVYDALRHCAKL